MGRFFVFVAAAGRSGPDGQSIVDAGLARPELEWLAPGQPSSRHATVLVRSFAGRVRRVTVAVPGGFTTVRRT